MGQAVTPRRRAASQSEKAQVAHGSWVVAFPSCPYETEGRCSKDPLLLNLLTSCRALKLLQDGYKVFVWMAFPLSGKTGRPYRSFITFHISFMNPNSQHQRVQAAIAPVIQTK